LSSKSQRHKPADKTAKNARQAYQEKTYSGASGTEKDSIILFLDK